MKDIITGQLLMISAFLSSHGWEKREIKGASISATKHRVNLYIGLYDVEAEIRLWKKGRMNINMTGIKRRSIRMSNLTAWIDALDLMAKNLVP